ncbi:MAG TPA: hypothetical protein VF593_04395 [Chthoniobacteraceae bacterium]|jgi:hypothetical protein
MDEILSQVNAFLRDAAANGVSFFNEAELQHELGFWLRTRMDRAIHVYFERPASSFFPAARGLAKKEIDLVVSPADHAWYFAIELKCPRNGRIPETMFDACRDLQLLEQLTLAGFAGGLFVMHVDDPGFYQSGSQEGIYSHFRAGLPLPMVIIKPTGSKNQVVSLSGTYRVQWQSYGTAGRYWFQQVTSMSEPKIVEAIAK